MLDHPTPLPAAGPCIYCGTRLHGDAPCPAERRRREDAQKAAALPAEDELLHAELLACELLSLVRHLEDDVEMWPEGLQRLAYRIQTGMDMPDQCDRCGTRAPLPQGRTWCYLCVADDERNAA